jgi:hypothetical protein
MANWVKTSPYGDYKDPLQNHKFDDKLIFNPKTNSFEVYDYINNIRHEAKWYYGKHIGSKKLYRIQALNRRANSTKGFVKNYISNNEK